MGEGERCGREDPSSCSDGGATSWLDRGIIRGGLEKTNQGWEMGDRDLYAGLIRLHILYHATKKPIFGLEMIEELGRHGYKLSPGTLYPLLHGLERRGYLRSRQQRIGGSARRVYRATAAGRRGLIEARERVRELFGELLAQ